MSGQTLQEILATVQVDEDGEFLTEEELILLEELAHRPLDLNEATKQQLGAIPLFTPVDVALILGKRKSLSGFRSLDEAVLIPGLSYMARQLLPIVTTVLESAPMKISLRNRWVSSGKDARVLLQTHMLTPRVSGGFTIERDPLEPSLTDYVSGFFITHGKSESTTLLLGDHQIVVGYGLLFGRSAKPMKNSGSVTTVARLGQGLRSYRSTSEYWALRGIAIKYSNRLGRWIVSISSSPKDASVENNEVTAFSTSGLHQTELSLSRKHNLQDQIALLAWQNGGDRGDCGFVIGKEQWTYRAAQLNNLPSKTYGSVYGRFAFEPLQIFGELASYTGTEPSLITGVTLTDNQIRWVTGYRYFAAGFRGPRSQPFREWSNNELNETGFFQGISLRGRKHRFFTYGDIYRQTAGDHAAGLPAKGFEVSTTWTYRLERGHLSVRWKREEKSEEDDIFYAGGNILRLLTATVRESWRISSSTNINRHFRLQFQADRASHTDSDTTYWGHALSVKIHFSKKPWHAFLNWVGFVADSYQSQIYLWDLNLPGELRVETFYPTGQSVAVLLRSATVTGATVSFRFRSTWEFSRYTGNWFKPDVEGGFQMDIAF